MTFMLPKFVVEIQLNARSLYTTKQVAKALSGLANKLDELTEFPGYHGQIVDEEGRVLGNWKMDLPDS
jgi:hypothetical protein